MNRGVYDLIVVGGGVAGASFATVMARAGVDVLVLEKDVAFRDRARGEFLAPWGIEDLRRLDLLETVVDAGAIRLPALAGRSLKPRVIKTPGGDVPLSFSHVAVQEALISGAGTAGADVVRGARVTLIAPGARPTVRYSTPDGEASVSARLVVGADGRSSLARNALGRDERVSRSARVLAGVRLADVPQDPSFGYFIIDEKQVGLASLFPQAGGMARAYVFLSGTDSSAYSGPGGYVRFMQAMQDLGVPPEALSGARPAGPLASFVADDSWVEHPAGGGIALLGDAAGISDPTWGQGLALAFRDARVLSRELLAGIDWRAAAHRYAEQRDRYFRTVITVEGWLTDLHFSSGPYAERRTRVRAAWNAELRRVRALDLHRFGPALDVSEEPRPQVFAEELDVVAVA